MAQRNFRRNSSRKVGFLPFIVCSILIHTLLFFLKIDVETKKEEDIVSIKYYDHIEQEISPQTENVLPENKKENLLKGQIVDIAKPEIEKKPEKSKFLSEYNSSVKKEQKADFDNAIQIRDSKLRKKVSLTMPTESTEKNLEAINTSEDKVISKLKKEKRKQGEMKGFDGDDGKYLKGGEKPLSGMLDKKDKIDAEGAEYVGGHRIPGRFLPYMNGNDTFLSSPSNDYLKDIEKGDETTLNTKKFVYAAYFNKIKQAISKHWTPGFVLMINDPGGHVYGKKNRYTKLIVHISSNGLLVNAKVDTSSGIDFLDREAINAFKMASPFSPPPEVLLNKDNLLEIRFGFMVSVE